jgi:hypothetical protein
VWVPYAPDNNKAHGPKGSGVTSCQTHNLHFLNALACIRWAFRQYHYWSSDTKYCIDALACPFEESCWKIRTLTTLALELALNFRLCVFNWVKRDANHVAHCVAKVAFSHCLPFCCTKDNRPPSVKEAWIRDLILLPS